MAEATKTTAPKAAAKTSTQPADKPAAKPRAPKKAAAPAAAASTAAAASAGRGRRGMTKLKVTAEQRQFMVAEAAYYRAERRGFSSGYDLQDWLDAEAEINRMVEVVS